MTITLPWKPVTIQNAYFDTSITRDEAKRLRSLSEGKSVIEVGTAYGYSACVMGELAHMVLSVDPHTGYGSMTGSLDTATSNVRALGLEDRVFLVVARSDSFLTKLATHGAQFDMAFIDGDHRKEAVTADIENAFRLVRPGGVVAVHDYGEATCPDVRPAVNAAFGPPDLNPIIDVVDTLWTTTKRT